MMYDPNTEHALIIADLREDDTANGGRSDECSSVESDAAYLLGGNDAMAGRPSRPPTGWAEDYQCGYTDNTPEATVIRAAEQSLLFT